MKSIDQQIAAARRELNLREKKYREWIRQGRLTRDRANHELECMFEIIRTLEAVKLRGGPQLDLFGEPKGERLPEPFHSHNPPT